MAYNNRITGINETPIPKSKLVIAGTSSNSLDMLRTSGPILAPLSADGGIVFEYTPVISVVYAAQYSPTEIIHSNYDFQNYAKTSVTSVTLQAKFSASTLAEANYMLAVIHFIRTFSKMNFGEQDSYRGQPPAIMNLSAYGDYMINRTPVAIRFFTLALPDDVDYVHTSFNTQVPVILSISLDLVPMPTPNNVRREFSLSEFASGSLVTKGYL